MKILNLIGNILLDTIAYLDTTILIYDNGCFTTYVHYSVGS